MHGNDPDRERPDSTVLGRPSSPRRSEDETAIEGSASRTTTPAFAPDDVVARRYRIIRYIARGGMGNVYEVEDLELGTRIALKTIRSEGEPLHEDRVRREINLARKVTHRNVCRLFDIGRHEVEGSGDEPPSAITFLTMELLDGVTLAQRLRDDGPMDVETAREVAVQLATGLDAAHRAGVVHRDLKSANVMLCNRDRRVAITDFGLARANDTSSTLHGDALIGTPSYMAPEQVTGDEIGPWTDIYAFGVVLYEMVTGRVPFEGDSMVSTAVQRLQQPPPRPTEWTPNLPLLWESTILRCLERDPQRRFGCGDEIVRALAGEKVETPGRHQWRRWFAAATTALILVAAIVIGLQVAPRSSTAPQRPSVTVFGFANLAGHDELDWLSTALAEMLTTELAAGGTLRTSPGESVARVRRDLSLRPGDTLSPESLSRIRALLGTDYVVLGSFLALDDATGSLRLDLHVQDTESGSTVSSIREQGSQLELFDLVERVGDQTLDVLGAGPLTEEQRQQFRASMPADRDAARLYAQGLEQLRVLDPGSARVTLEHAVDAAPEFSLAHAALAAAWDALGHDVQAREAAQRASQLSDPLPRHERLAVNARAHMVAHDWQPAIEIYRSLRLFFPQSLEYGLHLAACQSKGGQPDAALATLAALRQLPPPACDDPRIELATAEAAMARADFEAQLDAARRALAAGTRLGARTLVARAELQVAAAQRQLGRRDAALAAARSARQLFEKTSDGAGVIEALNTIAVLSFDQGDLPSAARLWQETLTLCEQMGHSGGVARALHNLANVALLSGSLGEAEAGYEKALAAFQKVGNRRHAAAALTNLATVRYTAGNSQSAVDTLEEVLPIQRELGDRAGEATVLNNMAEILAVNGQLDRAATLFVTAQEIAAGIGQQSLHAAALAGAGLVATAQNRLEDARHDLAAALEIQLELGETGQGARTGIALADTLREMGRLDDAETTVRASIAACSQNGLHEVEAEAFASLAHTLLAAGRVADASSAATRANELSGTSENIGTRLTIMITQARVLASAGDSEAATEKIDRALAIANTTGRVGTILRTRLIAAEVALAAADHEALQRLQQVEQDARALGFTLIAATARSMRHNTGSPLE